MIFTHLQEAFRPPRIYLALPKILILNAEFIILNAEIIILNAEFIILNAEIIILNTKSHLPPRQTGLQLLNNVHHI